MPSDLYQNILPCATREQCTSDDANKELFKFDESVDIWKKSDRKTSIDPVTKSLLGLANPSSDCWRFFYKTFNRLVLVTPDLPAKHTHYWDTLGRVAGRVVCLEWSEEDMPFFRTIFNKPWIDTFIEGEWNQRSLIMRAFTHVARSCAQWDEFFEAVLSYYYVYCWSTSSILRKQMPKHFDDATERLFEIWELIAEKCQEERVELLKKRLHSEELKQKKREIEKTICKIIGAAIPLLKILDKISDLGAVSAKSCWRYWKVMLFDYTFSQENLRGKQKTLIMTENLKSGFERFRDEFRIFLDEVKDKPNEGTFRPYMYKCDEILKNFRSNTRG